MDAPDYPAVWLRDDGILRIDYGLHPRVDLAAIRSAHRQHLALADRPLPVLVTGRGTMTATPEAEAFSASPEVCAVTVAVAVVASNPLARMAVLLYRRYRRPPYPFQAFDSEEAALQWLARFLPPAG